MKQIYNAFNVIFKGFLIPFLFSYLVLCKFSICSHHSTYFFLQKFDFFFLLDFLCFPINALDKFMNLFSLSAFDYRIYLVIL